MQPRIDGIASYGTSDIFSLQPMSVAHFTLLVAFSFQQLAS